MSLFSRNTLNDVRPEDAGIYSYSADSLLGSANASAKIVVQCKLRFISSFRFSSKGSQTGVVVKIPQQI